MNLIDHHRNNNIRNTHKLTSFIFGKCIKPEERKNHIMNNGMCFCPKGRVFGNVFNRLIKQGQLCCLKKKLWEVTILGLL